ncbi:unnamed protein product, partial [Mesorhabditis belari]|uniref:BZIP domain-containing protein n=1 Tax=Mesorhabditis belari TaxID=2138241 RepID=A0AAF3FAJ7_9BILA
MSTKQPNVDIAKPMPIFGSTTLFPPSLLPSMMRSLIMPFPSHVANLLHSNLPFLQIPKLADAAAVPQMQLPQQLASLTSLINATNPEVTSLTEELPKTIEEPPVKRIKVETEDGEGKFDRTTTPHSHASSTYSPSQESTPQPSPARKLGKSIPEEKKDEAYFERRRKNNDAAKRSRDLRRQKEEAIAAKATALEQDNQQLRNQH